MTHYDTLGLDPSATAAEIDDAYRSLVKVVHPDRGGDPYMFAVLTEAYDVLDDPVQRAAYDAALTDTGRPPLDPDGVEPGSWLGPYVPPPGHRRLEDLSWREIWFGRKNYDPSPFPARRSAVTSSFVYLAAFGRWTVPAMMVGTLVFIIPHPVTQVLGFSIFLGGFAAPFVVAWGTHTARKKAGRQP